MTNQTHTTFPTKKAAAEHQKRTSAVVHEGEEDKHILADRYKTKMCKNYVSRGECPYEVRCMFAHGDKELRTSEDNIRDGLITEEAIKAFQRQQNQARRRAAYAAAREAEAHAAAAASAQQERSVEEDYFSHPVQQQQQQQRIGLDVPCFIPQSQEMPHHTGFFAHNPYAYHILPAEAREFAVYAEMPEEEGYWYEESAAPAASAAALGESYYFPSSEMMAPLVPSSVTQPHYYATEMGFSSNGSEEAAYGQSESSDYSGYVAKAHCVAAEMPSFSDEVPMVLEP